MSTSYATWSSMPFEGMSKPCRPRVLPSTRPDLPYIGMDMVESATGRLLGTGDASQMKSTAFHFQPGDVLYGRLRPYLNKVYVAQMEGLCSSEFIVLPPSDSVQPEYLAHYMRTRGFVRFANSLNTGDRPRVSYKQLQNHEVPVAPLDEQRRIVAKLEQVLGKVQECKERLDRVPQIMKRFRQAVLAAACSGKLTEDWRGAHGGDPSGNNGWTTASLDDLVPKGGLFDGPFGSNLKTSDYTESGVRVVRLENVGHLRFIAEKETYISNAKYRSLSRHTVAKGDIIFSSFIGDEMRVCLLPELPTPAIAKADCFCIRPDPDLVVPEYLVLQLACSESHRELLGSVHGATRPRVNTKQLRALPVRLCSIAEQREAVRVAERLFVAAAEIAQGHARASEVVGCLRESSLASAFGGLL